MCVVVWYSLVLLRLISPSPRAEGDAKRSAKSRERIYIPLWPRDEGGQSARGKRTKGQGKSKGGRKEALGFWPLLSRQLGEQEQGAQGEGKRIDW